MSDSENEFDFESADNDEIIDRFHENPKEFTRLLARQVKKDLDAENAQKSQEDRAIRTFQDFKAQYPDFEERWNSGELQEFIGKHPGHNALSAYLSLNHESKVKQAVQAKLQEKGLGGSHLADTQKFGGTNRVLANRLKAMRAAGGDRGLPTESGETGDLKPTL
jgi:hypothetical protein